MTELREEIEALKKSIKDLEDNMWLKEHDISRYNQLIATGEAGDKESYVQIKLDFALKQKGRQQTKLEELNGRLEELESSDGLGLITKMREILTKDELTGPEVEALGKLVSQYELNVIPQ